MRPKKLSKKTKKQAPSGLSLPKNTPQVQKNTTQAPKNKQNAPKTKQKIKKPSIPVPQIGTTAFKQLQREWYAKLKDAGFKDIERLDHAGDIDGPLQANSLWRIAQLYSPEKALYYKRITNYLTHNHNWAGNNKVRYEVGTLYSQGVPYRKISAHLRGLGYKCSIWSVHKIVKLLEQKAVDWNKKHPEGLDFIPDIG